MQLSLKTGFVLIVCLVIQSYAWLPRQGFSIRTRTLSLFDAATGDIVVKDESSSLTLQQKEFICGYLNQNHPNLIKQFAQAFSDLGQEISKANAWSGGSMELESALLIDVTATKLTLQTQCRIRNNANLRSDTINFSLDANPLRSRLYQDLSTVPTNYLDVVTYPLIDRVVRKLCRLCWIVQMPQVTGKLIQMAFQLEGAGIGKLPENLYLNQVPHNRYVRQYFYDEAAAAVQEAVVLCSQGKLSNRMQVISMFPETNPSMDSYRIGTILEMVRAVAIRLAEENLRVKVCVQESMGVGIFTGVPKQLSGVAKLLQMMDWQSKEGEQNEGMIGDYVRFGGVAAQHVTNTIQKEDGTIVQHQDDVFLVIAPQSMVGTETSIHPLLQAMVQAVGDRPIVLINPDLTDKPSAAGQQSVRGRQERIDFANSFETIFQFQNIYVSGTSYFPILGAITKLRPSHPYIALQRRDYADGEGEIYVPVLASETKPDGQDIIATFEK
ncbi:hypothetical protein FisN_9Hh351 [Fistulifera solaris]|uniref:DUF1995 domain-containing protein n=1 Tax=Fistulifera solaris TaxID=1519565 RepID=A0A1Z5KCW1_FISSO|nr:hypothetical protein FisN_9Hh351 [Fistulifera solaris]|eukprot:GAX24099.1 hypothetical protein FisN_9Hh351 [Fistulifera solaris]